MPSRLLILWISFLLVSVCAPEAFSQISYGGQPPSFRYDLPEFTVPVVQVSAPDVQSLLEEDLRTEKWGTAPRFAYSVTVRINFTQHGKWQTLPNGDRICRLTIHSPGARALILYYDQFIIPEQGRLYIYDASRKQVIGSFTSATNPLREQFATEMIRGDLLTLEYHEPYGTRGLPDILISEIGYVYRLTSEFTGLRGFGTSDTCEVNVNCPEGQNWQLQKNGVARIIVKAGVSSLWCTGSLINNARMDFTPFFLTADHCGANATPQNYNQWIFYFRYESPTCENPPNDSAFRIYTMVGAKKIAASGGAGVGSDFKLLKLNEMVPPSYLPYFNGWSRTNRPSPNGVTIHHPDGDIKKISTYTDTLKSANWGTIPNTHWRVVWVRTQTNWGVTEGGSSGSPLFDNNGRIIGQLTGGEASCRYTSKPDYYGKFSFSWDQNPSADSTMLAPWLDPDNTGIMEIDGILSAPESAGQLPSIQIYPNPAHSVIYIFDPRAITGPARITIFNLHGKSVFNQTFQTFNDRITVNLPPIPDGLYLITSEVNGEIRSTRLIKHSFPISP